MGGSILDTNLLIGQWKRSRRLPLVGYTPSDARAWADELSKFYKTNLIVTPVYLEFVGGAIDRHEMTLTRAFLGRFEIADRGEIRPEDLMRARMLAERIPSGPRPTRRGAVDCLIRAIAVRLRCAVLTGDRGMPRI